MPVRIQLEVAGRLLRDANIRPRLEAAIDQASIEALQLLRLNRRIPVNTGFTKGSLTRIVNRSSLSASVGSALRHFIVLDLGRRPGKRMPPDQPIRQWILQRGLFNRALAATGEKGLARFRGRNLGSVQGKFDRRPGSEAERILDGMTWAIRAKIAREGTDALHFIRETRQRYRPRFEALVARAVAGGG